MNSKFFFYNWRNNVYRSCIQKKLSSPFKRLSVLIRSLNFQIASKFVIDHTVWKRNRFKEFYFLVLLGQSFWNWSRIVSLIINLKITFLRFRRLGFYFLIYLSVNCEHLRCFLNVNVSQKANKNWEILRNDSLLLPSI